MVGILPINILQSPSGLPFAIVLLVILGWIMFENRRKYMSLIN